MHVCRTFCPCHIPLLKNLEVQQKSPPTLVVVHHWMPLKNRRFPDQNTHPGGNPEANLKSISHRCHPILVAFVWELTKETIHLPQGCLQGGTGPQQVASYSSDPHPPPRGAAEARRLSRRYKGTSLIRNRLPLGPYSSICLGSYGGPGGGGRFL